MRTNADGLWYNGSAHDFYWNSMVNPNATIVNGLANCTTLAYGMIIEDGRKRPVKEIVNANKWHEYLTNGWMAADYRKGEIGDIIQWVAKCHVAVVSGDEMISGSYYTGEHGTAYYGGHFDSRSEIRSLKELSDFMVKNYPTRFFHYWSVEKESEMVGGKPEHILLHPLYSVPKDETRDQIEVMTWEQNVRNDNNDILRKAEKGFFNVLSQKERNGYTWIEVEKGKYIALIDGRVEYRRARSAEMDALKKENEALKKENEVLAEKLKEIQEICKR